MKILIVEDSSSDRELLVLALEEHFGDEAKFREAKSLELAHDYLAGGQVDAIVLDLNLPDSEGLDTFLRIHNAYPHIPVIVMTHNQDFDLAVSMIQQGAEDFILKDYTNSTILFRRIRFAIERGIRNRKKLMTDPPPAADTLEDAIEDPPDTLPSREVGADDQT